MHEGLCPTCGSRNPADTEFCVVCGAFLGWDHGPSQQPHDLRSDRGGSPDPRRSGSFPDDDRTRAVPIVTRGGPPTGTGTGFGGWPGGSRSSGAGADPETELRVELDQSDTVVVTPGAPPVPVVVQVFNVSTVVEAYRVTAVDAPLWLVVTQGQARLLPGTDEKVQVTLAIDAQSLIPAHRFRLQLRIQGESSQALWREVVVEAAVGAVTSPVQLRLEPSQLQTKDSRRAHFQVVLDNRRSNVPVTFELSGRDPEQQVRFAFEYARLEVPPGGTATGRVRVEAPLPPPGEQLNRTLTVVAANGSEELTATAGLTQSASAIVVDPPMAIRLDPRVVHAGRRAEYTQIILDNRRGTRPQRVQLEARDPENFIRFSIVPHDLEVPAGSYATARLSMQAPRPEPGESSTRTVTVSAWNGREGVEAQGQLVQETAERTPFMRVLLTLLGSLAMILGSLFLPWTRNPEGAGSQWNYGAVTTFLNLDTRSVDRVLDTLGLLTPVYTFVTVGGFTIFFGLLAAVGLLGSSGRLTRGAAVCGVLVLLLFAAAMVAGLSIGRGFPGLGSGYLVVLIGCVLAFVGSYFPKP